MIVKKKFKDAFKNFKQKNKQFKNLKIKVPKLIRNRNLQQKNYKYN